MKKKTVSRSFWQVGKSYIVRTVTYHTLGRLASIYKDELVFDDASYVGDSGQWGTALATGALEEVEVGPPGTRALVSRSAIVDAWEWRHPLPAASK